MELRAQSEEGTEDVKSLRRGWYVGDKKFRKELLEQLKGSIREHHFGEEREMAQEDHAERLVAEGLRQLGWKEAELERRRKVDDGKIKLALKLRSETTMTFKWIAARLRMGSWTHLNALNVYQSRTIAYLLIALFFRRESGAAKTLQVESSTAAKAGPQENCPWRLC